MTYNGSGRLAKRTRCHLWKFEPLDMQNFRMTMPMQTSRPAAPQERRGGSIASPPMEAPIPPDASMTELPPDSEMQQTPTPTSIVMTQESQSPTRPPSNPIVEEDAPAPRHNAPDPPDPLTSMLQESTSNPSSKRSWTLPRQSSRKKRLPNRYSP